MSKLSKLFRWNRKVDIKDGDKVLDTVYLRLVGDGDYQEARNMSLKRSRDLRIRLRNPESQDYKANFGDIDSLTKEEIVMGITIGEITNYRDEALMNVPEKEAPVLPDNASLEQQEEQETIVKKLRDERVQAIADYIEKKSDEKKAELTKVEDVAELKKLYIHSVINVRCEEEFSKVFREYQVYKGTYKDEALTELAFDSFDDFSNSAPQLKTLLMGSYINLELTGEELKN